MRAEERSAIPKIGDSVIVVKRGSLRGLTGIVADTRGIFLLIRVDGFSHDDYVQHHVYTDENDEHLLLFESEVQPYDAGDVIP